MTTPSASGGTACLYCGKKFVRKHPAQKFCPKNKAGRHLCKDRYHNKRRFACGEISEARTAYLDFDDTHPLSGDALDWSW